MTGWIFYGAGQGQSVGVLPDPSRTQAIEDELVLEWTTPAQTISIHVWPGEILAKRQPQVGSVEIVRCQHITYAFRQVAQWVA